MSCEPFVSRGKEVWLCWNCYGIHPRKEDALACQKINDERFKQHLDLPDATDESKKKIVDEIKNIIKKDSNLIKYNNGITMTEEGVEIQIPKKHVYDKLKTEGWKHFAFSLEFWLYKQAAGDILLDRPSLLEGKK